MSELSDLTEQQKKVHMNNAVAQFAIGVTPAVIAAHPDCPPAKIAKKAFDIAKALFKQLDTLKL